MKQRIAKYIASTGASSRREAERLIQKGDVTVNGKVLTECNVLVDGSEDIKISGISLNEVPQPRLWLYHKPRGLLVSHNDPSGRPTVFGSLPSTLPKVISVGRLDLDSEGLLLLTNCSGISRHLELPKTGWTRSYRVRVFGDVTEDKIKGLKQGLTVQGISYKPIYATIERRIGSNCWIHMLLTEGKNREIKNVMGSFGWSVNRLIRIGFGPFQLGELKPGEVSEVSRSEVDTIISNIS